MAGVTGKSQREFGRVRRFRKGGRWSAAYTGPDGTLYRAPATFAARVDAEAWLTDRRREIDRDLWSPPTDAATAEVRRTTFAAYAADWLTHREIKARTREHYTKILDDHLVPSWGSTAIGSITPDDVRAWYRTLDKTTPTMRSHIYGLMRTIMATAAGDGLIDNNPVHVRGAGTVKRASKTEPASLAELEVITAAMPERLRMMILLASWCALRFGELTELRRDDIVLGPPTEGVRFGVIRVRRAVVRVDGAFVIGAPKSDAGVRDVAIPPHLVEAMNDHLLDHVDDTPDSLLFPADHGGHLAPATLYRRFYTARDAANRSDLRFHDLRHTGAVLAAQTGATLAELMERLGHSTPQAAMKYQHAARGRDAQIAAAMSAMLDR